MAYTLQRHEGKVTYRDAIEKVDVTISEDRCGGLFLCPEPDLPSTGFIASAFNQPVDSPPLREIARGARSAVLLVSDSTRAVPTADVLPSIVEELAQGGVAFDKIKAVVGTGVHRPATDDEIRVILGDTFWKRIVVENHTPYDENNLVFIGSTSLGTPIRVNKTVWGADLRIVIGKVEPHEFAGFSGGRKSVLPGISAEDTIRINHSPKLLMSPSAIPGCLAGNPIHQDMLEAARLLGVHFCVNILTDTQNRLIDLVCGELEKSHLMAAERLRKRVGLPLGSRPELVVTTPGVPLNINLYQSIKALLAVAPIMHPNGVIVLYSCCEEGVDSDDMLLPFRQSRNLDGVLDYLRDHYSIQMDHAFLLTKVLQAGPRVVAVSPNISDDMFELLHMVPAKTLSDGIRMAFDMLGEKEGKVLFFPRPQSTLPYMR